VTADVDPLFVVHGFAGCDQIRGLRLRASRNAVAEKLRLFGGSHDVSEERMKFCEALVVCW
jgi:hypothetical protein